MTRGLDPERVNKSFVLHQAATRAVPAVSTSAWKAPRKITRVLLGGDVALVAKGTLTGTARAGRSGQLTSRRTATATNVTERP